MATDRYAPNDLLKNAAITGELLMGTGKSFPGSANKTLEDSETTINDYLTGAFLIAWQMDINIVSKDPTTPINVTPMYAPNGSRHDNNAGRSFQSFSACSSTKASIHRLTLWLARYWAARGSR